MLNFPFHQQYSQKSPVSFDCSNMATGLGANFQQLCQCLTRRSRTVQTVERLPGESRRVAVFINNEVAR